MIIKEVLEDISLPQIAAFHNFEGKCSLVHDTQGQHLSGNSGLKALEDYKYALHVSKTI